jgi:peptidyl-prolyl cis-trans isomerase A (cyclophilin A)
LLVLKTESGLRYQFIQRGKVKGRKRKTVAVHYEGSLENGKVFDSSYPRKKPIEFRLGQGQVIEGWDEGIALLQVGDKARFVIPSHLGLWIRGAGGAIPPNATLILT